MNEIMTDEQLLAAKAAYLEIMGGVEPDLSDAIAAAYRAAVEVINQK